jgi:pimeloyl-ACP methyl ester carboxylesterase
VPDWRRLILGAGVATAGVAVGYGTERLLFRRRLGDPRPPVELELIGGEVAELAGADGVRLHTTTYGPPPRPDVPEVVLVHGFTMTGQFWYEQVTALQDRVRIVTYDQPGHGASSAPRSGEYSIELMGDCLRRVIEETTGGDGPIVLVGHSLGAMTILAFVRRHPEFFAERVGALLMLSTSAKADTQDVTVAYGIQALVRLRTVFEAAAGAFGPRARELARLYRASSDLSYALAKTIGFCANADPRHINLAEQLVLDTDLETVVKLTPVILRLDEDEVLTSIDCPTIVCVGSEDKLTPAGHARHIAEVNPDVDLIELQGIGHMTPMTAADAVNALIVRLVGTATGRSLY